MFPAMPSYANMLRGFRMIEEFIMDFMNSMRAKPSDRLSTYALDSTKIDSHKAKNWPKSLRREATWASRTREFSSASSATCCAT